jgi:hypothetical protein
MMKLIIQSVLMLSLAGAIFAQPKLEIPDNSFFFGNTPQFSTVTHQFWFKSTGTDTLRIDDIKTGCSCAVAEMPRNWIAPGDSMKIEIAWDMKRVINQTVRNPYIFTNASDEPYRASLRAIGVADPLNEKPAVAKPFKAELSRLKDKSIDSVAIELQNKESYDMIVKVVSPALDEVEIFFPDLLPADGRITGYIKLRDEYVHREFKKSVTLEFGDAEKSRMTIPIRRKFY